MSVCLEIETAFEITGSFICVCVCLLFGGNTSVEIAGASRANGRQCTNNHWLSNKIKTTKFTVNSAYLRSRCRWRTFVLD